MCLLAKSRTSIVTSCQVNQLLKNYIHTGYNSLQVVFRFYDALHDAFHDTFHDTCHMLFISSCTL